VNNHSTIWMAVDLVRSPSSVKRLRDAPLPSDVEILLRVAAGDEAALSEAANATACSQKSVRDAAIFYIEQILLHPDADYYRVLGAHPDASAAELRRNMALLLRWLHPDHRSGAERSVFASRVTRAWGELKTEEKRAAYDLTRRRAQTKKSETRKKQQGTQHSASAGLNRGATRARASAAMSRHSHHPSILMRVLLMLFGKTLH
jgi:hypothetical protein